MCCCIEIYTMSWCKKNYLRAISTSIKSHQTTSARVNDINIQLLSESLHKQIFRQDYSCPENGASSSGSLGNTAGRTGPGRETVAENKKTRVLEKIITHLQQHNLWGRQTKMAAEVNINLPSFLGDDIDEHFRTIAQRQTKDYVHLAEQICGKRIPNQPKEWHFHPGWSKYDENGNPSQVDFPDDRVLVFDVEIVVNEGNYPTMATAVSDKHWYSWCSDYLVMDKYRWSNDISLNDLIPLETASGSNKMVSAHSRIVIGHNVGFDRSFVKEQYYIKKTKLRFLDTMSMHIAICGLTNLQRVLYKAAQNDSQQKAVLDFKKKQWQRGHVVVEDWKEISALNNLKDVHKLHVGGRDIDKDPRNIFIEGTTKDVRDNFQGLMNYCAGDVVATWEVFNVLWPEFKERFPHPVTLAGMLEMGTGYLPININWERYIHQSNSVYEDMQRESKQILMNHADEACLFLKDNRYKDDPWLWNLDWSVKEFKVKKQKLLTKKQIKEQECEMADKMHSDNSENDDSFIVAVLKQQERHYKNNGHLCGHPQWYRDLCYKLNEEGWTPGPSKISHQKRVTPSLLRLKWDGFPLHYDDTHGWGYLVPGRLDNLYESIEEGEKVSKEREFPYRKLCEIMKIGCPDGDAAALSDKEFELKMNKCVSQESDVSPTKVRKIQETSGKEIPEYKKKHKLKPAKSGAPGHTGDGPYNSVNIPGCWFYKIPHKDGKDKRVGNPLAKDYINLFDDGTLSAHSSISGADQVFKLSKACNYWKNNQKRIESQMSVWLTETELTDEVKQDQDYIEGMQLGAIVPRIVPSGTVTRRAVEPTWLTASNAYVDRIGSELKSMIQSPPGYCFVGADVDSQELWIGAVLGDAHFGKEHGCTALGWMTLQGTKNDKTDLHSVVAKTVGISRDHAKVFNYSRIYGAGQQFAEKLLLQFNHRMSVEEAKKKAHLLFSITKGKKSRDTGKWTGGSESSMFNKLEEIACHKQPRTPVLGCCISKALEPDNVNEDFMTSRINWVVQSSAVDYLHLMLVCMKWLCEEFDINGRFCISIHDEVRYLMTEEDRYRAALALQITNLLTRAMFAYKLGMSDLPQSVAFFSAVDIDKCLRKEVTLDCVTPSNPHGLKYSYQIVPGEALDIHQIIKKTGDSLKQPIRDGDSLKQQSRDDSPEQSIREQEIMLAQC